MKVLVVHASKAGSTAEIAERIADTMSDSGLDVVARPVADAEDPTGFDAVVLGSAVYLGRWLKEANAYVAQHGRALSDRPLWLFSSGPIGTARVDDQGRDLLDVSEPRELPGMVDTLHPREHRVFFGALEPRRLSVVHRALRLLPAGRRLLPEGDFRQWAEVDRWATGIAAQLTGSSWSGPSS